MRVGYAWSLGRFRLIGLVVLALAFPALSQTYDVVGLVQDEANGEPIGQVEISLQSGKILGYTKSNGRFEITVNSHNSTLVFKRHTFKNQELDLTDIPNLIGLEITMESDVQQLANKDTTVYRRTGSELAGAHTMEELELMQGMRIDLNDHLRQLPGVSGMNEFTNDISVWGSRTGDVTHYLGQSRIPSLRHLDIGFPGNESVLNPRLLKAITVSDNLAKGPVNQGNASALVYDLKDGDPNNITGDLVFGTVNRELNMTGYWGGRTFLISGRYLEPTFLANLGTHFFTQPKDVRAGTQGKPCDSTQTCQTLKDPFIFSTMDGFLGTFYRDSTGAYARHSLIILDDSYTVKQDVATSLVTTEAQTIVNGTQDGWMYAYENLTPFESGDLTYSLGVMHRNREESFRDTLPSTGDASTGYPWYFQSGDGSGSIDNTIGDADTKDWEVTNSFQWNPNGKMLGANYGYGLDLEYMHQEREFRDLVKAAGLHPDYLDTTQDYALLTALWRLKWSLANKQSIEAAVGAVFNWQALFDGQRPGLQTPAPLASIRYTRPLFGPVTGYGELALRANTAIQPTGFNRIDAVTTSSAESKLGAEANFADEFKMTSSVYTRLYKNPILPQPEVFWNYAETHSSDYAYVSGANVTFAWLPSHHFGINTNTSVVQGYYHLQDNNTFLPWEANRTLDMVTNIRVLPRRDSLLSFILTYGANTDAPLYEYTGLWNNTTNTSTQQRAVQVDNQYPSVSRERVDARINLDLQSHWRPLNGMRFFFEADNIFADFNASSLDWLGGDNLRKRGWTRANANGDLVPVVTKGLGLFIMFGFEGNLLI